MTTPVDAIVFRGQLPEDVRIYDAVLKNLDTQRHTYQRVRYDLDTSAIFLLVIVIGGASAIVFLLVCLYVVEPVAKGFSLLFLVGQTWLALHSLLYYACRYYPLEKAGRAFFATHPVAPMTTQARAHRFLEDPEQAAVYDMLTDSEDFAFQFTRSTLLLVYKELDRDAAFQALTREGKIEVLEVEMMRRVYARIV